MKPTVHNYYKACSDKYNKAHSAQIQRRHTYSDTIKPIVHKYNEAHSARHNEAKNAQEQ